MGFAVEKKETNLIKAVPTMRLRWDINRSHDQRHAFRATAPAVLGSGLTSTLNLSASLARAFLAPQKAYMLVSARPFPPQRR